MAMEHGWSHNAYFTTAFNYTVWSRAQRYERTQPCTLVVAAISANTHLKVPCFYCDKDNPLHKDEYLGFYAHRFATLLCSHYSGFPRRYAEEVSNTFKSIVEEVNNIHHLSCQKGEQFTTVHRVEFCIYPLEMDEDRALRESAGPRPKPASIDSVQKLVAWKYIAEDEDGDRYESGWIASDHDCVICMEGIQTWRSSLAMECSHVFHKKCLVKWLKTSHVCPLCRYQMPTDDSS